MSLPITTFEDLVSYIEGKALAVSGIQSFTYDLLSGVNNDPKATYPLIRLCSTDVPDFVMDSSEIIRGQYHAVNNLTFEIIDRYTLNNTTSLEAKYTALSAYLKELLTGLFTADTLNQYQLNSQVAVTMIPYADNDQTVKIRVKFQIKTYLGDRF